MIGYCDRSVPEVVCNPAIDPTLVVVSIEAMAKAFFDGINRFLIDLFTDAKRRELAEKRLPWLLVAFPFKSAAAVE